MKRTFTVHNAQRNRAASALAALLAAVTLAGCHQDMWNQPKLEPLEVMTFFEDNRGSRGFVEGTIPYDGKRRDWIDPVYRELTGEPNVPSVNDRAFWTGMTPDGFAEDNYFEINELLIQRGQERYEINCMPCHGLVGDGQGIIAQRGFPPPASYHTPRLREVEDGYIYDVITHGFGRMYSYAARVQPEDRWAIAAYLRALQASQNVNISDPQSPMAQEIAASVAEQESAQKAEESHGQHGEAAHDDDH